MQVWIHFLPVVRPPLGLLNKRFGSGYNGKKPGGNRPLQPVVDKFFYWLRASRLETDRVAYCGRIECCASLIR